MNEDSDRSIILLGRLLASTHRIKIFTSLSNGLKTPVQIGHEVELEIPHVSKTLKELEEMGLVQCRTPALRKGRIYSLTEEGKRFAEILEHSYQPRRKSKIDK